MKMHLGNDWDLILDSEINKPYFKSLITFVRHEYETQNIFPLKRNVFKALSQTAAKDTRVVILGQDPYYKRGLANGLCFSVCEDIAIPASLKNIFLEMKNDGYIDHQNGDLTYLAQQGVLLLNTVLTVREGVPNSHAGKGWEVFTDYIIQTLNSTDTPIVFLLWGNNAKQKSSLITNPIHRILTATHPSPLSAYNGFFGCKHFSKTNDILKNFNMSEIQW